MDEEGEGEDKEDEEYDQAGWEEKEVEEEEEEDNKIGWEKEEVEEEEDDLEKEDGEAG